MQEEAAGKTRKLKKVWSMLQSAKSELTDLQVIGPSGIRRNG